MPELLAQGVQELVGVPAAGRAREGEQLLAAVQCVGAAVQGLRGGGGALQADVGVGVHAALVVDLIHRSGEGLLPRQRQAGLTVSCEKGNQRWLLLALVMFDPHCSPLLRECLHWHVYNV